MYSSPWGAADGQWIGSNSSAPLLTLSAGSLNFGTQSVGTVANQTLTLSNSGTAALSISSLQVSGTNSAEFGISNGCGSSVAPGDSCSISLVFQPAAVGSRSATLSISDNASGSPQTVGLSGTGSSAPTPTGFTTYLGPYGSGFHTITGNSAVLPLRAYLPSGASQIEYFYANLNATAAGTFEYEIVAESDGAGGFTLRLSNGTYTVVSPAWPYLEMVPSGKTVTLSTPISVGTVQITAYRFELAGNEFQLDLSITRTGSFSDQIVILGQEGNNYSTPWNAADGIWSNP